MAEVGETSSHPPPSAAERPLVVRVKRKLSQSPVEALWLEISERPLKRALLDFQKLSLSGSFGKEQSRTRRVFVKHVETVSSSQDTIDVLHSFVQPGSDNGSRSRANNRGRPAFRKENKQDQLLSKAKQEQEALAKSARFEQIWRSRRGNKEAVHGEELDEVCHLYDVVRVDGEETSEKANKQERMSKEDEESVCKFLPMLREFLPDAAEDIEADIKSYAHEQAPEEFVYDLYTVGDSAEEMDVSHPFPLVQVNDDDEWDDGADDSEYESDDSNAENHPLNDYPEESDEEVESNSSTDESEKQETGSEESETGSEEEPTTDEEGPKHRDLSDNDCYDGEMDDPSRHVDSEDDDAGNSEDWRWTYR